MKMNIKDKLDPAKMDDQTFVKRLIAVAAGIGIVRCIGYFIRSIKMK